MSRRKQTKPQHLLSESQPSTSPAKSNCITRASSRRVGASTGSHRGGSAGSPERSTSEDTPPDLALNSSVEERNSLDSCSAASSDLSDPLQFADNGSCSPVSSSREAREFTRSVRRLASPQDLTQGSLSDSQLLPRLRLRVGTRREIRKELQQGHHGGGRFNLKDRTCKYCGVIRNSPADLQRHLRKHTGEKPFACAICQRAFKAKRSLQYHQYMHHGIEFKNTNIGVKFAEARHRKLELQHLRENHSRWLGKSSLSSSPVPSLDSPDEASYSAPEMREEEREYLAVVRQYTADGHHDMDSSSDHQMNESHDTGIESNGEDNTSPVQRPGTCKDSVHTNPDHLSHKSKIAAFNNGDHEHDESAENSGNGETSERRGSDSLTEEERSVLVLANRTCQYCSKVCPKPSDLKRHLMVHTGERPFKCDICGKAFKAKGSMQYHQKAAHGADIELSQGLEERYLRLKHRAYMMSLNHKAGNGKSPLDLDSSMDSLLRAELGHSLKVEPEDCMDDGDSQSTDSSHFHMPIIPVKEENIEDNGQEDRTKNGMCQAPSQESVSYCYNNSASHNAAVNSEDGDGSVVVIRNQEDDEGDAKNFAYKESILEPGKEVIVSEEAPFVKNRISVKNETVLVTRLDGINLVTGARTSLYKCHMCGKMFDYLSRLQCHLSVHFERHMTTYQCSLCGANFKFKTQLLRHSRVHSGSGLKMEKLLPKQYSEDCNDKVYCDEKGIRGSPRKLSTPTSLSEGQLTLEECEIRDEEMELEEEEEEELELEEDDGEEEELDEEDLSPLSTDSKSDIILNYSNRPSHTYQKINGCYACLYCKKTFFRLFSLQRHERMHTGVKPCYCKECGKGFSEPRNLRQHILRFHNDGFQMDFVRKARKRAIIASLRSSARATRVEQFADYQPNHQSDSYRDAEPCGKNKLLEEAVKGNGSKSNSPDSGRDTAAMEFLQKEGIKEEVTVVIPSDVPLEHDTETLKRQSSSNVSESNWSETISEPEDDEDGQNAEIMAAPKRPLLSFRKEGHGCKSRRKSSVPVKIENMSPPQNPHGQDETANNKPNPKSPNPVIKEEPMSPTSAITASNLVTSSQMGQVLFSNTMSMAQTAAAAAAHPLFLSSHLIPTSGLPVNPVMSIPITVQVPIDPHGGGSQPSSNPSPSMGLMAQVSPNDFLVGYPRVKWEGNPLAGIPASEPLPRRRSLSSENSYPISSSGFGVDKNSMSSDGRKVTSLSRTHSRLHMHPPYANPSTTCSTVTGFYSRLHVVNAPVNREKVCKPLLLPDGRSIYRCVFCSKDFPTFSDINRHMDFHEDIRPYKCKFCDYYARTNSQLKVHMMRHQGIREFCCKLCNYKGVTQSDLNRHMKSQIHMLKSRNECPNCLEGFVTPKNLERHMQEVCQARSRSDKAAV